MNTNLYSNNEKYPSFSQQNIYPSPQPQILYQSNPQCIYNNSQPNTSNYYPVQSSSREITLTKLNQAPINNQNSKSVNINTRSTRHINLNTGQDVTPSKVLLPKYSQSRNDSVINSLNKNRYSLNK